ncbi:hypothetical protein [Pseudoneobacillus rhizosphaerae]|uniref:hypothetical protein n=1 Tax=Pseudoneobacillus rhizosphaerae TaxID=2880968 RepID=UPI001E2A39BD|nr:hypothetical protein [Pseudoneobacillus rhizosphaerae]
MKDFHCCATCEHFRALKSVGSMNYLCSRLGFETKPKFQFNCWNPKENIKRLIEKNQQK